MTKKQKIISNNEQLVKLYDVVKKIEESCIDNQGNISNVIFPKVLEF